MADNFRVLDVRVDELAANLNALDKEPYQILSQDYYSKGEERRVTVLLVRAQLQVQVPPGFDPRRMSRN
jgi:hypothetical protein